jgi:hypothetical protein
MAETAGDLLLLWQPRQSRNVPLTFWRGRGVHEILSVARAIRQQYSPVNLLASLLNLVLEWSEEEQR